MGLLDDAIREHLDLKRRRGADPADIERAEREALGPVRRNRGDSATAEAEPELADLIEGDQADETGYEFAGGDTAYDEPGAPGDDDDEPVPADEQAPPRLSFSRDEGVQELSDEHEDETPSSDDDDAHETRVMRIPDEAPVAPPSPPEPTMSDATAEYDVEDALAAEEGEGDDEDVLEETPEFLQDTPDHDRLWFEQRPPRDFDFDG